MNRNLEKKIGVWLDHRVAHFIDISKGPAIVESLESEKHSQTRFKGESGNGTNLGNNRTTNNEHHRHNQERMILNIYLSQLLDRLKDYDSIYLFGPTTAKNELFNKMQTDKRFDEKNLRLGNADEMTEKQMIAEVKHFFNI